jgi:hypothetical protein
MFPYQLTKVQMRRKTTFIIYLTSNITKNLTRKGNIGTLIGNLNAKVGDRHKTMDLEQKFRKNGKHFVVLYEAQELVEGDTMKHHKVKWVCQSIMDPKLYCLKINVIKTKEMNISKWYDVHKLNDPQLRNMFDNFMEMRQLSRHLKRCTIKTIKRS